MVGSSLVSIGVVSAVVSVAAAGAGVSVGIGAVAVVVAVVLGAGVEVSALEAISCVAPLVKLKSNETPSTLHLPIKKTNIKISIKKNSLTKPMGLTLISISLSKIESFLT